MASSTGKSYPSTAFILSLIGGIFILLAGLYDAAVYAIVGTTVLAIFPGLGALLIALAVLALLFGLIIIVGAIMLRSKPESAKTWGIIILLFAIFSWVGSGGFVIGFILALIGGILALTWRPPVPAQPAWGQQPMAPSSPPGWGGQPPATPPPS
jgi:hypothetical protein